MIGRTLLQQALPITFGLRAAGWLVGLDAAATRLREVRAGELAVQMGGPVGARAPGGRRAGRRRRWGWPSRSCRGRRSGCVPSPLAAALGAFCGVLAKIARDVTLLAQTGGRPRSREGGDAERGGSSAMAHKRNPVSAVSVLACAKRAPGLVATALAAMEQEHERAAGSVAGGVGDPHRAPGAHRLGGGVGA